MILIVKNNKELERMQFLLKMYSERNLASPITKIIECSSFLKKSQKINISNSVLFFFPKVALKQELLKEKYSCKSTRSAAKADYIIYDLNCVHKPIYGFTILPLEYEPYIDKMVNVDNIEPPSGEDITEDEALRLLKMSMNTSDIKVSRLLVNNITGININKYPLLIRILSIRVRGNHRSNRAYINILNSLPRYILCRELKEDILPISWLIANIDAPDIDFLIKVFNKQSNSITLTKKKVESSLDNDGKDNSEMNWDV